MGDDGKANIARAMVWKCIEAGRQADGQGRAPEIRSRGDEDARANARKVAEEGGQGNPHQAGRRPGIVRNQSEKSRD